MKRNIGESIIISDLSTAVPKSAITSRPKKGCWYSMDYELVDGTRGVMLTADPVFQAVEIRIPLNVVGIYKVYIGVNYFKKCYQANPYGSLWVKLSGDRGFSRIGLESYFRAGLEENPQGKYREKVLERADEVWLGEVGDGKNGYNTIYEVYWRTEDLTGKSIVVSTPKPPYSGEYYGDLTNISFIRLESATDEELKLIKKLERQHGSRNMAAIWCAGALSGHTAGQRMYHPESRQWFEDEFQAYRGSDFGIFCMEAIRGNLCLFPTKRGDVGTLDGSWKNSWVDPLAEFARLVRKEGMRMFVGVRMIGGGRPYAFNPINWSRFFWNHREWVKISREGNLCSNLSLAYAGVREYWLELLREVLDYGIDGILLYFNRGQPFVLYEEPSVSSFMQKHDVDPRELPADDERWQTHVAGYVTRFVREVRSLLDEKPGRELAVIFRGIPVFRPGMIIDGCDPDTWIEKGLIDYIFCNLHIFDRGIDYHGAPEYIRYWKKMGEGRVQVYSNLMPRQQPGEEYAETAEVLYNLGADGFCVWDSERRIQRASEWNVLKYLGHRQLLGYFKQKAPDYYRFNRIKLMRGLDVRYSYTDG